MTNTQLCANGRRFASSLPQLRTVCHPLGDLGGAVSSAG